MAISPQFLDELRNRVTVSDIVGRRVKLIRAGREFKGCCPFHNEKTPSFYVNDQKQFYHCFGCGAHGDVLKFVMEHDNMPFRDGVEMLAAEAGMEVPIESPRAIEKAQKAKDLSELMSLATSWYTQQLMSSANQDVQKYLADRDLESSTLAHFQVGYAPDDSKPLIAHIKNAGFTEQDMIDTGLMRRSKKNNELYGFFRDRVMFPVADRRGRIVAFGGRALPDHIRPPNPNSDFTPPKYLNSSDTVLFDKGQMLYGEDKARRAAVNGHSVIVTEGYMDVIACHAAGFEGAVAPMGTAMTEAQIENCWRMIVSDMKEPILCFDGDNAGQKAAARACERVMPLLKPGCTVKLAFMPQGEDPDSLIKSGGNAAFQKILTSAMSLIDYIWHIKTTGRDTKTPEARAAVIKSIKDEVFKIQDQDVQRHYKALIDERISNTFFSHYNNRNNNRGGYNKGGHGGRGMKPSGIKPRAPGFIAVYERALLATVINHPYIFDYIEEELAMLPLRTQIKDKVINCLSATPDITRDDLIKTLFSELGEKEVRDIVNETIYVHAAFAAPTSDSQDITELVKQWKDVWNSIRAQQEQKGSRLISG